MLRLHDPTTRAVASPQRGCTVSAAGFRLGDHFLFCRLVPATVNAIRAFTEPGDDVALVRPLYTPLQSAVTAEGRRLVAVDSDRSGAAARWARPRCAARCRGRAPSRAHLVLATGRRPRVVARRAAAVATCAASSASSSSQTRSGPTSRCSARSPMALACADVGHARAPASSPNKTWNLAGLHVGFVVLQGAPSRALPRGRRAPPPRGSVRGGRDARRVPAGRPGESARAVISRARSSSSRRSSARARPKSRPHGRRRLTSSGWTAPALAWTRSSAARAQSCACSSSKRRGSSSATAGHTAARPPRSTSESTWRARARFS